MIELYHDWRSFCSIKVRICLAEKHLPWESRFVDLTKLENTSESYLALNPNGFVPTLVHDGTPIWESTCINEYLDEVFPDIPLSPRDPAARARMRHWVKFQDDVLHPVIRPATLAYFMSPALRTLSEGELATRLANHPSAVRAEEYRRATRSVVDPAKLREAQVQIVLALERLERQLSMTPWLAGDSFSLADVAAAPFIDRLEELNLEALMADRPGLQSWMVRTKARPAYQVSLPRKDQRFVGTPVPAP